MKFRSIRDIPDLKNSKVVLRVDLNVPIKDGQITDTSRINRIKPTLEYLTQQGAKVALMSHLGRPKGKVIPSLSLQIIADYMGIPLSKASFGDELSAEINRLSAGKAILLENIRFFPGEESNDRILAKSLASSFNVFVNDAFSVSHRAHMSVEAITHDLPSYAGFLMEEEMNALEQALTNPQRPLMAIVGGAKVSTKLHILGNLAQKVDTLVIGGAMANTFLMAQGYDVGASLVEEDLCEKARHILESSKCSIILPEDVVVAPSFSEPDQATVKEIGDLTPQDMILDIGPKTVATLEKVLEGAKTVVLNGPLGVFETPPFDLGTIAIYKKIADLTQQEKLTSIAGGGDTVSALKHSRVDGQFTYVSTAGGAFLEWLEGRDLPGVEALKVHDE